ncbi:hypothetical protein O6H91_04G054100 [Diphasiastrum complanatum]|uniref:Uncharacterized protein n=1 Tax=Diphasiastrum complanatum TaxID=34168 RepID=A0ACC2DXJ7_DIPCM|nr:hypothetical protein O6H91_04G054100 [Diphasiastrum complanatum]
MSHSLPLFFILFFMNVVSWNVRGLNSPIRRSLLYRYISSLPLSNLVICLQETKLSGFLLDVLIKSFAHNFNYSCSPADGSRDGLLTLVSRDWKLALHSSIFGGRANLCTITKCGFSFNIYNIYAPNSPHARIDLWNAISPSNSLPSILLGDFNMYLHPLDGPNHISFTERWAWDCFMDGFNCIDVLDLCNSPRLHTWNNGRLTSFFTSARLDCVYLSKQGNWASHFSCSYISSFPLSNHLPVLLRLKLFPAPPSKHHSVYIMNNSLIWNKTLCHTLALKISSLSDLGDILDYSRSFVRLQEKISAFSSSFLESSLKQTLSSINLDRACAADPSLRINRFLAASSRLKVLYQAKASILRKRTHLNWLREVDLPLTFFFKRLQSQHQRDDSCGLTVNGSSLPTSDSIGSSFHNHFSSPFNLSPLPKPPNLDILSYCSFSFSLSFEESSSLCSPLSLEELHSALKAMNRDKTPGPNWVTPNFFLDHWNVDGLALLRSIHSAFSSGSFPASLSQGLIKLVPKIVSPSNIFDYRPLTMLNTSYKIVAKAITKRIAPFLPTHLSKCQSGFIKGNPSSITSLTYGQPLILFFGSTI